EQALQSTPGIIVNQVVPGTKGLEEIKLGRSILAISVVKKGTMLMSVGIQEL
ncbi:hypothetical protein A2U01_0107122, partial [Trifolium medium]|nr:hypothetical protein [Trifolium medium]